MFTLLSLLGFTATLLLTGAVRHYALARGIIDDPEGSSRKVHKRPVALLGGVGIYLGLLLTVFIAFWLDVLPQGSILSKHLIGLLLGGFWLVLGGYLDDKCNFSPKKQIVWPVLAVLTLIAAGVGIESLTNPLGGQVFLDQLHINILTVGGVPYKLTLLADLFTFVWLMGVMYATKFFDGLDGLVSGITIIGAFTVFFTSLLPKIGQTETALVAIIVASCFAGFLVWNFHPAKMFLGEGGSTLAGFLIGTLAIIAESKVSTTLVVMALPILDLIWVIFRRTVIEHKSPTQADRKHIHHRLLDSGLSHRGAVLVLYLWALTLGVLAWFYQSTALIWIPVLSFMAVVLFAVSLVYVVKKNS